MVSLQRFCLLFVLHSVCTLQAEYGFDASVVAFLGGLCMLGVHGNVHAMPEGDNMHQALPAS